MNLKDTYNKIANDWFNDHKEDRWWKPSVDIFAGKMKRGDKILDVGCGPGIASKYLSLQGFDVTGIDLSEEFVSLARREAPSATFTVVDITSADELARLPQFEGIIAKAVFLHLPKSSFLSVLKNICEHLKPGGYFYIAVKEKRGDASDEAVVREDDYGYEYERFFSYYTLSEVKESVSQCGLHIVHEETFTPHKTGWVIVIGKK